MREKETAEESHNIHWFIFICTAPAIIGVCIPLVLYPEQGARSVSAAGRFEKWSSGYSDTARWVACCSFPYSAIMRCTSS